MEADDRLQKMRQEAAEYAERFELRQVLQDMFQRVIKERPENPFDFMQEFISQNNSARSSKAASAILDVQDYGQCEAKSAVEAAARREQEWKQLLTLAEARAALECQRARSLEQQLRDLEAKAGNADASTDASSCAGVAGMQSLQSSDSEREAALTPEIDGTLQEASQGCADLERRCAQQEANAAAQRSTADVIQHRIQGLETAAFAAPGTAALEREALARSYEQQLDSLRTQVEVLQHRIQAYEARVTGGGHPSAGAPPHGEVNTHMLSQLSASAFAPAVPLASTFERQEDEVTPPPPDAALLVEVADCQDSLSNGIFAWIGTCNLRPMYRLLGPEPRYLHYFEADIASHWRIVDKTGSEDFIERFRLPADAALPVACEQGDMGGRVVEARLTAEVLQRVSTVSSQEERATIRDKFAEVYGQKFVALEGQGRGLISGASPVVAVAHALEAQQRALQLFHQQLKAEIQRRESSERHARNMEEAFVTLQLKIQAQLPAPPSVSSLWEAQAQAATGSLSARSAGELPALLKVSAAHDRGLVIDKDGKAGIGSGSARCVDDLPALARVPHTQDRGIAFERDGQAESAPDLGPGCEPAPHPPMAPKDRKPLPPPIFRRGLSGLRNAGRESPRPPSAGLPTPASTLRGSRRSGAGRSPSPRADSAKQPALS